MRGFYLVLILYVFLHNAFADGDSKASKEEITTRRSTTPTTTTTSKSTEPAIAKSSSASSSSKTESGKSKVSASSASTSLRFKDKGNDDDEDQKDDIDVPTDLNTLQPPKFRRFRRPFRRGKQQAFRSPTPSPWRQNGSGQLAFTPEQQQALNTIVAAAALALQNQFQYAPIYNLQAVGGNPVNVKLSGLPSHLNSISPPTKPAVHPLGSQASLLYAPSYIPIASQFPSLSAEPSPLEAINNFNSQLAVHSQLQDGLPFQQEGFPPNSLPVGQSFDQSFEHPFSSNSITDNGNGLSFLSGGLNALSSGRFPGRNRPPIRRPPSPFQGGIPTGHHNQNQNNRIRIPFPVSQVNANPGGRYQNPSPSYYQQFTPADYPLDIAKSYYQQYVALPPETAPGSLSEVKPYPSQLPYVPGTAPSNEKNVESYPGATGPPSGPTSFTPTYSIDIKSETSDPNSGKTVNYHYSSPSPYKPYKVTFEPSKLVSPEIYATNQLLTQSEQYFKHSNPQFNDGLSPEEFLKSTGGVPGSSVSLNPFYTSKKQLSSVLKFEPSFKSGAIASDSIFSPDVDTSQYFYPVSPSSTPSPLRISPHEGSVYSNQKQQQQKYQYRHPQQTTSNSYSSYSLSNGQQYSIPGPGLRIPQRNNALEPEDTAYYSPSHSSSGSSFSASGPSGTYTSSKSHPYKYQFVSSTPSPSFYSYSDPSSTSNQNLSDLLANPSSSGSSSYSFASASPASFSDYSPVPSSSSSLPASVESNPNLIISAPVVYYPQHQQQKQPKSRLRNIMSSIQDNIKKFIS